MTNFNCNSHVFYHSPFGKTKTLLSQVLMLLSIYSSFTTFIFKMFYNLKRHSLHSHTFHLLLVQSGTVLQHLITANSDRHASRLRTPSVLFDFFTFSILKHSPSLAFVTSDNCIVSDFF